VQRLDTLFLFVSQTPAPVFVRVAVPSDTGARLAAAHEAAAALAAEGAAALPALTLIGKLLGVLPDY